jgi:hypothetical protein
MIDSNLFWYKKDINAKKKKVIAARNLKDCLPKLPRNKKSKKENLSFLMPTILCFPEVLGLRIVNGLDYSG